jgi:crossover junction endodeoxyribonuclease RuvC
MNSDAILKIIGVDPGLTKTGWGVVCKIGGSIRYVDCGVIKTEASSDMEFRLSRIFSSMSEIVEMHKPKYAAMEKVFVNRNPKTSEKLMMGRTASFLALALKGMRIREYSPTVMKKNITGCGHADKNQVYSIMKQILGLDPRRVDNEKEKEITNDAIDALAIATCSAFLEPKDC